MGQSILTSNQRQLLDEAARTDFIRDNFFLTGGTALSEFYFQHRLSEDLDFFSLQEFNITDLLKWAVDIKSRITADQVEQKQLRGQLTLFFHFKGEVVKVDFGYFPFEHIGNFTTYKHLNISSIEDIATNKVQALQNRKRARDYFDIYEVCQRTELDSIKLLSDYRAKFGVSISKQELAKAYTGVVDAVDMPRFLGEVDWSKVEAFFIQESKNLLR